MEFRRTRENAAATFAYEEQVRTVLLGRKTQLLVPRSPRPPWRYSNFYYYYWSMISYFLVSESVIG